MDPVSSSPLLSDPVPGPSDWTLLVSLVVSVSGFALLVLLVYGIVFCCERRKRKGELPAQPAASLVFSSAAALGLIGRLSFPGSSYQDEMM